MRKLAVALARLGADRKPGIQPKGRAATAQEVARRKGREHPPQHFPGSNLWRYAADADHPLPPDEAEIAHRNAMAFRPSPRR